MVYKLSPVTIGIILKFIQAVNKLLQPIPKVVSVPTNRKPKTSNSAKNIILKASKPTNIWTKNLHYWFTDHCEADLRGYSQFLRFLPKRFK